MRELQQYFKCVTGHKVHCRWDSESYKYLILPLDRRNLISLRYGIEDEEVWYLYWEDGTYSRISGKDIDEHIVSHADTKIEAWRLAAYRWFS